jgi:subtilisin family serine protease
MFHLTRLAVALALGGIMAHAHAQLRLPSVGQPLGQPLGNRLGLDGELLRDQGGRLLAPAERINLATLRLEQVTGLLSRHGALLEADPRGEPVVRREILAWSPSAAGRDAARRAGLVVLREEALDGLDGPGAMRLLVLGVPAQADTAATLTQLRERDPDGVYDFNHVYLGSGAADTAAAAPPTAQPARKIGPVRVGLIDSGIDPAHMVFRTTRIKRWGCAGTDHPSTHGTAVAALMVGQAAPFKGVAPAASLYAADIYCDSPTGGAADKIAAALAWMAREQVGVINISLVGPSNAMLERMVGAMTGRGHLLVAAVGNDGPAAPPLYPASYPGVVGVSAVDKRGRTLPEAARGPQVMFAAPGSNMVSAAIGPEPYRQVRGTSFAAPIVAAMLAQQLAAPGSEAARAALAALAAQAVSPGPETGRGVVGAGYRIDPSAFR